MKPSRLPQKGRIHDMEKTNLFNTSQNCFAAVVLAGVIALFATASFVTSPAAQAAVATPPSAQPAADGNGPIDCTGGCTSVTCSSTLCTVWYCEGGHGCNPIGSYERRMPKAINIASPATGGTDSNSTAHYPEYRYVSLCPEDSVDCSVYELTTKRSTKVGHYLNARAARTNP